MNIKKLEIIGFKSIDHLVLEDVSPFTVFAGANGAGKSNIVDALVFFSRVISLNPKQAMREFGGFAHVHCFGRSEEQQTNMGFGIEIVLNGQFYQYALSIINADSQPQIEELLKVDDKVFLVQIPDKHVKVTFSKNGTLQTFPMKFIGESALRFGTNPLFQLFLNNTRIFRIDPLLAKAPCSYNSDDSELSTDGSNVATILAALENDENFVEQVMEWLELIVPSMEEIKSETQHLDASTILTFQEEGTQKRFPARLVSDGTMYTLCILTAVLSRIKKPGITIIEEPERGIHPKAIGELVNLMRENASVEHPILLTTHSEAVVRNLEAAELSLVDKEAGETKVHYAKDAGVDDSKIPLDKAWLTNLLDGGLPW